MRPARFVGGAISLLPKKLEGEAEAELAHKCAWREGAGRVNEALRCQQGSRGVGIVEVASVVRLGGHVESLENELVPTFAGTNVLRHAQIEVEERIATPTWWHWLAARHF